MAEAARPIAELLREFVDGFNTNSLDQVMTFVAEDAVHEPGDGRTHRGRAAIREVLLPQFSTRGKRPHLRRDLGLAG
ncbi:MAG TPA: nuclear transport factor 2 family protein [Polyangia bacterium]|nr:nuclear transport factor 2 family protein [Polyangia bacterium]